MYSCRVHVIFCVVFFNRVLVIFLCHVVMSFPTLLSLETTKVLQCNFFWPTFVKDAYAFVSKFDRCESVHNISKRHEMPLNNILKVELFYV